MPRNLDVLVVEHNPIDRRLIAAMLEAAGHRPIAVADGITAIDMARTTRFHIILMDVGLPGLDGVRTMRLIRALGSHNRIVPILAITGQAELAQRADLLAAGLDGHLAKPFGIAELYHKLATLTDSERAAEAA